MSDAGGPRGSAPSLKCDERYSITEGEHKGISNCVKPAEHPEKEHKSAKARWLSLEDWPQKEKE